MHHGASDAHSCIRSDNTTTAGNRWPVPVRLTTMRARGGVWLVAIVMLLAACDAGESVPTGTDSSAAEPPLASATSPQTSLPSSTSTVPTAPPFDRSDPHPVLTIGQFAWAIPEIWLTRDVHTLAVYPSGNVVRLSYQDGRWTLLSTHVADAQVEAWVSLVDQAGLSAPGALPAEPSPSEIVDGSYHVFTRRVDEGIAFIAVDQTCVEGDVGRRALMCELLHSIPQPHLGAWSEVPVERWAIQSHRPLPSLEPGEWPWSHLHPATLEWEFNDAGLQCAIVTDADWPYSWDEAMGYPDREANVFRRPLLPHEQTCADVFEWRSALEVDAHPRLSPYRFDGNS